MDEKVRAQSTKESHPQLSRSSFGSTSNNSAPAPAFLDAAIDIDIRNRPDLPLTTNRRQAFTFRAFGANLFHE